MSEKITVPTLGESVTEATVSKWLKSQGDKVVADEPIVELETDKVNVEVPAPTNGVLGSIKVKEGETVNVGSLLGTINDSRKNDDMEVNEVKSYSPPKKQPKLFENNKETQQKKTIRPKIEENVLKLENEEVEDEPLILEEVHDEKKATDKPSARKLETKVSPAARKMASEAKIDLDKVKGTGKNGIILKEDIMDLMGSKPAPSDRKIKHGPEERVRMTRLRLTIAKRLKEAQENAAMLTTFNEVDMSEVISMRNEYKDEFQSNYGVKLGFMGLFLKASSIALQEMPIVNASIEGTDIIYHGFQDIGVAVSTERGLVVPVIRNVSNLSIAEIENSIKDYSIKARDGKLSIDDMTGGTFTVSNGGVFGSLLSTPILNPPQSAILGMHKIQDRPMVVDGNIEIRPMMYLALTYDHRLLDGKDAVSFLVKIKESLESPESMMLGI